MNYSPGMVTFGGRRHVRRRGSTRSLCGRVLYLVEMSLKQRSLWGFAQSEDTCKQCVAAFEIRSVT